MSPFNEKSIHATKNIQCDTCREIAVVYVGTNTDERLPKCRYHANQYHLEMMRVTYEVPAGYPQE